MKNHHMDLLARATQANPALHAALMARPRETAMSLGISLSEADIEALRTLRQAVSTAAREHDDGQARSDKLCIFYPVFATLPKKGPGKLPKPRKKGPKPS